MKTTFKFIFVLLLVMVYGSCTIQKRSFNKGYHMEWNRKFKKSENQPEKLGMYDDPVLEKDAPIVNTDVEEIQTEIDTVVGNDTPLHTDPEAQSGQVLHSEKEQVNRTDKSQVRKNTHLQKSGKPMAYGGSRRGIGAIVFIVVFGLIFLLIYFAFNSANYAGGFLLLIAAGYLLVIIFIVLFIILLLRLFLGAFR